MELHSLSQETVKDQLKRLKKFKANRKSKEVEKALTALEREAKKLQQHEPAEVCEQILASVKAKVSLGEIAQVFRSVAGVHKA